MGSLSITDIATGRIQVLSGHMVNGELLNDSAYALTGYPETDDQLMPRHMGLEPYIPPRFYPLECEICGQWAGDVILSSAMSEPGMEETALEVKDKLCPKHWQDRKWGRL